MTQYMYLDDFSQCRKKTISYRSIGAHIVQKHRTHFVQGFFVYEVVPGFFHTHAEESFRTRILCTRIFVYFYNEIRAMSMLTFVDHTIYWKIDYKFLNENNLSSLVELISNDTPYTPTLKPIKQSSWKLNGFKNNIAAVLPITGHPN